MTFQEYCNLLECLFPLFRIMKKLTLIFSLLMATAIANAQTLDSIAHHVLGYYGPNGGGQMDNIAQLEDGSVLFVYKVGINFGSTADVVGNVLYRVSRHGAVLMDTLFIPDKAPAYCLFDRDPNGNGNIRVGVVNDTIHGNSFLQIFPFDNDLNYDTLNEVFVPLSDTTVTSFRNGCFINEQNELVLSYYVYNDNGDKEQHFGYFGLDGTLRYGNSIPYTTVTMNSGGFLGIFNDSPLEYYWYGRNSSGFVCHIFDSLFQHKDFFTINDGSIGWENPQLSYRLGWKERMVVDGDDFIFCSRCELGQWDGVCLVRYDKYTFAIKKVALFESRPMLNGSMYEYGACPVGLGRDSEGSIYFAYYTQQPMYTDLGQVAVVKTDADFNVQWQRFCLEPEGFHRGTAVFTVLDDGGVAMGGGYMGLPEVFFLILSDEGLNVSETEASVRPYGFWPNPVHNTLNLQYSPDITPKQIELYDLQGRLVRSQRNGLESLNLQGLSAGQYVMKVTLENGKVFSDKVVKE